MPPAWLTDHDIYSLSTRDRLGVRPIPSYNSRRRHRIRGGNLNDLFYPTLDDVAFALGR